MFDAPTKPAPSSAPRLTISCDERYHTGTSNPRAVDRGRAAVVWAPAADMQCGQSTLWLGRSVMEPERVAAILAIREIALAPNESKSKRRRSSRLPRAPFCRAVI